MKVLHAALMSQLQSGVVQQMSWENEAARRAGVPWEARIFVPTSLAGLEPELAARSEAGDAFLAARGRSARTVAWLRWRRAFYAWLRERAGEVDLIVLRYTPNDPFRALALRRLGVPVVNLHHTLELDEMLVAGQRVARVLERRVGPSTLRAADGIAAVTGEILSYELRRARASRPGWVYPNGALWDDTQLGRLSSEGPPELLFVADRFQPWQGLDLLLESLAACRDDFVLHLVGEVPAELVPLATADPRVRTWGRLDRPALAELTDRCLLGVTSLALFRKHMEEACTLKVREYLSRGLPVYSGHRDVFPDEFPHYRVGPPDISSMLEHARSHRGASRADVVEQSRPFIAKDVLVEDFHARLVEWVGSRG